MIYHQNSLLNSGGLYKIIIISAITAHAMIKGITISIGISPPSYDFNKYVEKRRNPTIKKKTFFVSIFFVCVGSMAQTVILMLSLRTNSL